jgi:cyclopropane fatty-acyl-phospholipid synthase-like methyltransferase
VNLPFSDASEQNKSFIFDVIKPYLHGEVLEVGSGTGQHAVFFAGQVPQLHWQTSDLESNLVGIEGWIADSGSTNLLPPITLDVRGDWPQRQFDLVYSANCFHIMDKTAVMKCIEGVGACLKPGASWRCMDRSTTRAISPHRAMRASTLS